MQLRRLLLAFLFPLLLSAQGVRIGPQQISQATTNAVSGFNLIQIPAGAVVTLCGYPANAVPCTNKAVTFTDATLATQCPQSQQIVLDGTTTCVSATDAQGNLGWWVKPGQYTFTVNISGVLFGPYFVSANLQPTISVPVTSTSTITAQSFSANNLTPGNCVQATTGGQLVTASGPCGTSSGTLTATGSPVSGQCAIWSGGTSLTGFTNCTYSSGSGFTLLQGANATDLFYAKRFTDTSPTGNFLHFQNNAANTDLFKLDVLGNGTFGTSATSPFYQGTNANQAQSGVYRCASSDSCVTFRNNAGSGDVILGKNTNDRLTFSGNPVPQLINAFTAGHLITIANAQGDIQDSGAAPPNPVKVLINNTGGSCSGDQQVCGISLSWGFTWPDTNYTAQCTGFNPSNTSGGQSLSMGGVGSLTTTTITVYIVSNGSSGGSFGGFYCWGIHN